MRLPVALVLLLSTVCTATAQDRDPQRGPGIRFDIARIAAEMSKLRLTREDLSPMFDDIEGVGRWPDGKARVHLAIGPDMDPACAKTLDATLDLTIAELQARSGARFTGVASPADADAVIELNDVPLLDRGWQAAVKQPGAQVSYKAPRTTMAVRWDMATVWFPQRHLMAAGWAYEGIYYSRNRTRPGMAVPCAPFPMTWWLVHISKPHDRSLLNHAITRNYDVPELHAYDILNFTIMNADGVAPGMKGRDLAAALRAALP